MRLVALVPGREKRVVDPIVCVIGIGKRNGSVTVVGGVGEIEGGGSVVLGSSLWLGLVAIAQYV